MFDKLFKEFVEPGTQPMPQDSRLHLFARVAGRVDLIVRHGDQVYADEAFKHGTYICTTLLRYVIIRATSF